MELCHFKQPIEAKLKHTWAERSSLDGELLLLLDDPISLCCLALPCTPGRYLCRKLATLPKSSLRTNLLNQQSLACLGYHSGSTLQVSFPAWWSSKHGSNHRPRISGEGSRARYSNKLSLTIHGLILTSRLTVSSYIFCWFVSQKCLFTLWGGQFLAVCLIIWAACMQGTVSCEGFGWHLEG